MPRTSRTSAASAATHDDDVEIAAAAAGALERRQLDAENQKAALAFRKQVAAHLAADGDDRIVLNRFAQTDGHGQVIIELAERKSDGKRMVTEFHGLVKNFPRAARLKRSGNALDEEEAEEREPLAVQDQPQDQAEEVVVVRAIRPHRTACRKEKTAAIERQQAYEGTQDAYDEAAALDDWEREEARRAEAMGAPAARHSKKAATTKKQKRSTKVTLRKALADDGSSAADSAAFVTPARRTTRSSSAKKSKGKQQPNMIREDVEEHHTTGDFSAGLARGQDDLVSLLNGLEGCEIRSDLGSESTQILSREGSIASMPVAAASHAIMA